MGFNLVVDAKALTDALDKTVEDMPRMIAASVMAATGILYAESRRLMQTEIYDKPPPIGKRTGKPLWVQTGNLMANEQQDFRTMGFVSVGIIYNQTPYANWRHEMDKVGKYGSRIAHWRDDAIESKGSEALAAFDDHFNAQFVQRGL